MVDDHLPAARQRLSQVDEILIVELHIVAKLFAECKRQQSLLLSMADSQLHIVSFTGKKISLAICRIFLL